MSVPDHRRKSGCGIAALIILLFVAGVIALIVYITSYAGSLN